jgi:hypothetical protein
MPTQNQQQGIRLSLHKTVEVQIHSFFTPELGKSKVSASLGHLQYGRNMHKLGVFKDLVRRKISGPKGYKIAMDWRK